MPKFRQRSDGCLVAGVLLTEDTYEHYGVDHIREVKVASAGEWEVREAGTQRVLAWYAHNKFAEIFTPADEEATEHFNRRQQQWLNQHEASSSTAAALQD